MLPAACCTHGKRNVLIITSSRRVVVRIIQSKWKLKSHTFFFFFSVLGFPLFIWHPQHHIFPRMRLLASCQTSNLEGQALILECASQGRLANTYGAPATPLLLDALVWLLCWDMCVVWVTLPVATLSLAVPSFIEACILPA